MRLEERALESNEVVDWGGSIFVGWQQFFHEAFVRLYEARWHCVPYDSKVDLETLSGSWMSSLIAEEGSNAIRSAARHNGFERQEGVTLWQFVG